MTSAEYFKKNKKDFHTFLAIAYGENDPAFFWDNDILILDRILDRMEAAGVEPSEGLENSGL